MLNRKSIIIVYLFLVLLLLSSCFERTEKKIYQTLEDVVKLEEGFKKEQEPLIKLEEEEKAIYDKIIDTGFKEREKINKLADKAIDLSNQRLEHLDLERESIIKAEKKFITIKKLINRIDDKDMKVEAENLYDLMANRYKVHEQLYKKYSDGIKSDQKLYHAFKDDETTLSELEKSISEINNNYEQVYQLNEEFNKLTNNYNEAKLKFYKNVGIS
ncbi:YkyA family protein [Bacillus andreraoultii]|uniref:YkyA family protein n=1 Tax=Bacillus andreraoultii TaxID=1499685 RepID=UPI000A766D87|nr:YkyA family protein [Bacillus andreraoultii]